MAMGEEELHESEVLWPEPAHDDAGAPGCSTSTSSAAPPRCLTPARRGGLSKKLRGSRPVDIPMPARSTWRREDDDEGGSGGTMVPPHVLVSRRRSEGDATFALRSGPGRARELSHLRHSVLRMTGFIEG